MGDELAAGQRVGHYLVVSRLGAGGMGAVYLAEHPEIRRRVAIKVLSSEVSHQPGLAERFLTEARAVARIDHPNVIAIHDFARTDEGQLYYVMEWLRGRELTRIIEERAPMPARAVVPYLEQICAGLQAAHEQGIVHRDLKPENIFVLERKPFTVKLLDFGIARLLDTSGEGSPLTQTGLVIGSPLTIAPEQAAGQRDRVSPRTDLYSLGVILYWMLSGRPPFQNPSLALLLASHIQTPPPSLRELAPGLPPAVVEVVHRCLEKDPERRHASAEELAQAFAAAAERAAPATGASRVAASHDATLPPVDPCSATTPVPASGSIPPTEIRTVPPTVPPTRPGALAQPDIDRGPEPAWSAGPRGTLSPSPRVTWQRAALIALGLAIAGTVTASYVLTRRPGAPAAIASSTPDLRVGLSLPPPDLARPSLDAARGSPDAGRATLDARPRSRPEPAPARPRDRRRGFEVQVILGTPTIQQGPLTPAAARAVARRGISLFRRCYELALAREPGIYGRVELELELGRTGSVESARPGSASIGFPAPVGDCMATAARQLRFPSGPARLRIPIVLRYLERQR